MGEGALPFAKQAFFLKYENFKRSNSGVRQNKETPCFEGNLNERDAAKNSYFRNYT